MNDGTEIRVFSENDLLSGTQRRVIRVRRGNGPEEIYDGLEQAPPDIRALVSEFDQQVAKQKREEREQAKRKRRRRSIQGPGLVFLDETPKRLRIRYYRFWWLGLVMALGLLPLLWNMGRQAWQTGRQNAIIAVIKMVLLLPLVFTLYISMICVINRSVIEVCDKRLSVYDGPLPWYGNWRLKSAAVLQLYCTITRGRRAVSYNLLAITKDGRSVYLLRDVSDPRTVLFIEEQIERWLGIADWPELSDSVR